MSQYRHIFQRGGGGGSSSVEQSHGILFIHLLHVNTCVELDGSPSSFFTHERFLPSFIVTNELRPNVSNSTLSDNLSKDGYGYMHGSYDAWEYLYMVHMILGSVLSTASVKV